MTDKSRPGTTPRSFGELVAQSERLSEQVARLEQENAALKAVLTSDPRMAEVETELESFAALYVASFQLHSSLRVRAVLRHVRELLVQLVGARSLAVYVVDDRERELAPIIAEGVDLSTVLPVPLRETAALEPTRAIIERTYLTGVPHIEGGDVVASPAACLPLQVEEKPIGVIVVHSLLEHKKAFVRVDRELFKLLSAHAGVAIVSACSWQESNGKTPSAQALRELCA